MRNVVILEDGKVIEVGEGEHMAVLAKYCDDVDPYDNYAKAVVKSQGATVSLTDYATCIRCSKNMVAIRSLIRETHMEESWWGRDVNEHVALLILREVKKTMTSEEHLLIKDVILKILKNSEQYGISKDDLIHEIEQDGHHSGIRHVLTIY